jgi:CHAT domain-containing protein
VEPSEALRRAKLSVRDGVATMAGSSRGLMLDVAPTPRAPTPAGGEKRSHPFYWAAFELVGH